MYGLPDDSDIHHAGECWHGYTRSGLRDYQLETRYPCAFLFALVALHLRPLAKTSLKALVQRANPTVPAETVQQSETVQLITTTKSSGEAAEVQVATSNKRAVAMSERG